MYSRLALIRIPVNRASHRYIFIKIYVKPSAGQEKVLKTFNIVFLLADRSINIFYVIHLFFHEVFVRYFTNLQIIWVISLYEVVSVPITSDGKESTVFPTTPLQKSTIYKQYYCLIANVLLIFLCYWNQLELYCFRENKLVLSLWPVSIIVEIVLNHFHCTVWIPYVAAVCRSVLPCNVLSLYTCCSL